MFKKKLIYRAITIFLVFALMIIIPLSFTMLKQARNIISGEEVEVPHEGTALPESREAVKIRKEFVPVLIDNMLPYIFYILLLAFLMSIFFSRKILISLKQLLNGARALRDGNLDIQLAVISDDELGEVTKSFNEMSAALKKATDELARKNRELRKRREDENAQLLSLSSKLGAATDLKDIMGDVIGLVKDFFGADFLWLLAYDNEENLLLKASTASLQRIAQVVYKTALISVEQYAINEKKPITIADMQSETRFYLDPLIAEKHYRSAAVVPMFIGKKPVGALSLYYIGPRIFREEELHFLEIIGNILAVSMERSEFYTKAIRAKELSDTILQSAADCILTVDTAGRIISANKACERILGVLPENAVGVPVCSLFQPQENEGFSELLCECVSIALDEGKPEKREALMTTAQGNQITVLISSAPILARNGQVTGVVNLFKDISMEKEIDRMKGELVRSVSHEFRTPLSAIVGMTEMILNGDIEDEKVTHYLNIIKSEGLRLSQMVSELLSIARIESGKKSFNLKAIDVNNLIRTVIDSFAAQSARKEADIRYSENSFLSFIGDEEKIKQLLINLLANALTFSDNHCIIEIEARRKQQAVEIIISDNGWGISQEDIPHITERFYRGKHGKRTKGTGLGLALCKEIVRMHGGEMEITSKEGEGTRIFFTIPDREKDE